MNRYQLATGPETAAWSHSAPRLPITEREMEDAWLVLADRLNRFGLDRDAFFELERAGVILPGVGRMLALGPGSIQVVNGRPVQPMLIFLGDPS